MKFKADEVNFFDFFRTKQKIPFHQRPYVWQKKDLDDFWEDLLFVDENRNTNALHFLGSIVTSNQDASESRIIDGQQRVTTYIIFALALYKKAINILDESEVTTKNPNQTDEEWRDYRTSRQNDKQKLWEHLEHIIRFKSMENIWELTLTPSVKDKKGFNQMIKSIRLTSTKVNWELTKKPGS